MSSAKKYILDKSIADKKLRRMALEILENNMGEENIILAGIRESGSVVARCMQKILLEIAGMKTELISISMDKKQPRDVKLSHDINFDNRVIIVTDDVANSGRTILYALKPFLDYQPKKIQTLVLVERTHSGFPVRPDYVGLSISTTIQEHIYVEVDGDVVTGAYLK